MRPILAAVALATMGAAAVFTLYPTAIVRPQTDNAAFEQAKEDLARLMGRMAEIEQTLREATILTQNGNGNGKKHSRIVLGSIVTLARDDGRTSKYTLVSSLEASPNDGKVSDESPIGRALYGRKRGEKVAVQAPSRTVSYTITDIQ